jgi:hypothetical protein
MTRYVWHDGHWLAAPKRPPEAARAPMIIRDHMAPAQHPCTGEILESKSAFRARTRAHGCVELGNDGPTVPKPPPQDRAVLRQDIATAIQQVEQGYRPPPASTVDGDARIYGK